LYYKNEIERAITENIYKKLQSNKIVLLIRARCVGKTKIIQKSLKKYASKNVLKLNGEDKEDPSLLSIRSIANYKRLLYGLDLLVINEAQHIKNIGFILKLIVDKIGGIKVLVTGSSMFDLNNELGNPS
jgi:predicted AAA+ superfamily ATPase